ncbi:MAG: DUF5677 domain-containing protein [Acidobacteriaceae bacterium]
MSKLGPVFGFEEFWPKVYAECDRQFDAIADLMSLANEIVKSAEESADEPAKKVICALARTTMAGACEAIVLCGNGCGPGAMKIVRGMYESRWTAEYLRLHLAEVEDYLEFSKILSWRRLHWLQENNPSVASLVPQDAMKQVEDDYEQAKVRFTDNKGRVRLQWSTKSVRKIASDVGREKEYELPYSIACSIHHGNFEGLSAHFTSENGPITPDPPPSMSWVRQALLAAYTNVWFALNTLNHSCGLDLEQKLDAAQRVLSDVWKK